MTVRAAAEALEWSEAKIWRIETGNTGPFITLRFPTTGAGQAHEPPTVYVQGFTGALYLDKPHEILRCSEAFESIWEDALSEADSTALFRETARETCER